MSVKLPAIATASSALAAALRDIGLKDQIVLKLTDADAKRLEDAVGSSLVIKADSNGTRYVDYAGLIFQLGEGNFDGGEF